ncbi:hypothetical protein [Paenibacillus ehimensis]|uniref:hypothetical protein n=1 Tax=Paenibacillus ehimensis TaxID=79264 RepID=UPI000FDA1C02|nr:hypothetical protein [Paenibacillus ehimensis]
MNKSNNEKTQKLVQKALDGNEDIQVLIVEKDKNFTFIGGARVDPSIMLICHVSPDNQMCFGKIGDKYSTISKDNSESNIIKVVLDTRKTDDVKCHYYYNDYETLYPNEIEEKSEGLLIAYIENASFCQFYLFDNSLNQKFVSSFAKNANSKQQLRTIAFSYISKLYPTIRELIG